MSQVETVPQTAKATAPSACARRLNLRDAMAASPSANTTTASIAHTWTRMYETPPERIGLLNRAVVHANNAELPTKSPQRLGR